MEYLENVKLNVFYSNYYRTLARRKAKKFDLEDEAFQDVLDRMETEAEEYLDFEEILEFFTRRGRPKRHGLQEVQQKHKLASAPNQTEHQNKFDARPK